MTRRPLLSRTGETAMYLRLGNCFEIACEQNYIIGGRRNTTYICILKFAPRLYKYIIVMPWPTIARGSFLSTGWLGVIIIIIIINNLKKSTTGRSPRPPPLECHEERSWNRHHHRHHQQLPEAYRGQAECRLAFLWSTGPRCTLSTLKSYLLTK